MSNFYQVDPVIAGRQDDPLTLRSRVKFREAAKAVRLTQMFKEF